ncbi:MAG: site-specific integrase [Bacteroidia bacterium]|jgi:integrase/recombinase XerD|nr:site-specific integrase [Bacteroidia bacterium]
MHTFTSHPQTIPRGAEGAKEVLPSEVEGAEEVLPSAAEGAKEVLPSGAEGAEGFNHYLQQKGLSPTVRIGIHRTVARFTQWAADQQFTPEQTSPTDIAAYLAWRKTQGNTPRTQQITLTQLNHYFTHLQQQQHITRNPCTGLAQHGIKRRQLYYTFTPAELQNLYQRYSQLPLNPPHPQHPAPHLMHERNQAMLSLLLTQGLRTEELTALTIHHLHLRQAKLTIPAARRKDERTLTLEATQLYPLSDYQHQTRPALLAHTQKQTTQLFITSGTSTNLQNLLHTIAQQLKTIEPRFISYKQLRASVITHWLKTHPIRQVQYMAGHRYISSTEAYQANNLDALKEDLQRYHPNL